jgi:uncharacterized membrane protein (DUF106 family)
MAEEDKIEEKKETILPENKEGETTIPLVTQENKKAKEGSFMPLIVIMIASTIIAFYWDKLPWIGKAIHFIFDPTAGALLNWNRTVGMIIIVFIITLLTTLVQKYATDQKTLKELKKEQKEIQKQTKEFKNHPEKLMELQQKQMAMLPKQMKLSMRAIIYTGIPFILFFRWFNDYFIANPTKFFGFIGWFWFYFIFTMLFSSILRKYMDVV